MFTRHIKTAGFHASCRECPTDFVATTAPDTCTLSPRAVTSGGDCSTAVRIATCFSKCWRGCDAAIDFSDYEICGTHLSKTAKAASVTSPSLLSLSVRELSVRERTPVSACGQLA